MTPTHRARRAAGTQRSSLVGRAAASDTGEGFRGVGVWGRAPQSAQGCSPTMLETPKSVSSLPGAWSKTHISLPVEAV